MFYCSFCKGKTQSTNVRVNKSFIYFFMTEEPHPETDHWGHFQYLSVFISNTQIMLHNQSKMKFIFHFTTVYKIYNDGRKSNNIMKVWYTTHTHRSVCIQLRLISLGVWSGMSKGAFRGNWLDKSEIKSLVLHFIRFKKSILRFWWCLDWLWMRSFVVGHPPPSSCVPCLCVC